MFRRCMFQGCLQQCWDINCTLKPLGDALRVQFEGASAAILICPLNLVAVEEWFESAFWRDVCSNIVIATASCRLWGTVWGCILEGCRQHFWDLHCILKPLGNRSRVQFEGKSAATLRFQLHLDGVGEWFAGACWRDVCSNIGILIASASLCGIVVSNHNRGLRCSLLKGIWA